MRKQVVGKVQKYHQHKVKMAWVGRFDQEARCEIRRSIRKLKEIRDFGDTLKAF